MNDLKEQSIHCEQCNAVLTFKVGTHSLGCNYCGFENNINACLDTQIQTFNIEDYERETFENETKIETALVRCNACSAETTLGQDLSSKECPFCGTPLVLQQNEIKRLHKAHYLLPFDLSEAQAHQFFQQWVKNLWFAPSALKKSRLRNDKLKGLYLPFWSYDCDTATRYQGQRGTTHKTVVKTRSGSETHRSIKWTQVSGRVEDRFKNVLIPASKSIAQDKLDKLQPWDLTHLTPYDANYLKGFQTENYQLTLREGYETAKIKMATAIREHIRHQIGGDHQRITHINTQHGNPTFKHLLLPVWLSAYRFRDKTYQFVVNARTGEVQGDRPYSVTKIIIAIFIVIVFSIIITGIDWQGLNDALEALFR